MDQKTELRRKLYEQVSQVAGAIASPSRMKIIQLLSQSPRTVEDLSELVGESVANTSQHLKKLSTAGLVTSTKQGLYRIYRVSNPSVTEIWEQLQDLASVVSPGFSESCKTLTGSEIGTDMSAREVLKMVADKKAILIDTRDIEESEASPVHAALRVSAKDLVTGKHQLPSKKPVFLFCRGRFCSLATPAVSKLRAAGYKCYRLTESPHRLNQIWKSL